jgi:hypothetical protein
LPSAKEFVITVSPSATVIDKLFVAVCPELDTCTLKLLVPDAVGVPEITPWVDRLRPVGRVPLRSDQE